MKKILIVAMADSVHTARWIRQFDEDEIEFVLFPSTPHRRVHPLILQHMSQRLTSTLKISKWMKLGALPTGIFDLIFSNFFRAKLLAAEINSFQPDFVHVMETQHSGYLTDKALANVEKRPKIVLSIWGSDLFWFQQFPKHEVRIRSFLKKVDLLIVECKRDQVLAIQFGYEGKFLDPIPATGGLDTQRLKKMALASPPSQRKFIAVKGYSGFVGLGQDALKVIEKLDNELRGFFVIVYSAGFGTWWSSRKLRRSLGNRIVLMKKHQMSNLEIEEMFLRSRIAIGLSMSDGLPATVKEAMCTGVFPVQTDTSCAGEWFESQLSGFLVPPNDVSAAAAAVLLALKDDQLVDNAMNLNLMIAESRFASVSVSAMSKKVYLSDEIFTKE